MKAQIAYTSFVERVRQSYAGERIKDGVFGAMMEVQLINDVSSHSARPTCTSCCSPSPVQKHA